MSSTYVQAAAPTTQPGGFLGRNTLVAVILFATLCLSFGYFVRHANANGNSRLALVFAAIDDGTLTIDAYHEAPLTYTIDKSINEGHYYSDKAIGTAVLGGIAYLPVSVGRASDSDARFYLTRHWVIFFAVGLPVAGVLTYLFLVLSKLLGDTRKALTIVLLAGLATPLWPFATEYFGHALVAAVLFAAFLIIVERRHCGVDWTWRSRFLFGSLLGFSIITEYTSAPAVAVVGVYYLYDAWGRKELQKPGTWVAPAIGAVFFLSLQLAYNAACFGSPFSLGYGHIANSYFRPFHEKGFLGVGLPKLDVLYYISLHPYRGIFLQAPVLACGLAGLVFGMLQPKWRVEAILCAVVGLLFFLINAGFGVWWGGWTFTARHVIPGILFLMLGLLFLPARARPLVLVLGAVSLVQMALAVFGDPLTPDDRMKAILGTADTPVTAGLPSPIWSQIVPALKANAEGVTENVAGVVGLEGLVSLIPFVVIATAMIAFAYRVAGRTRSTT